MLNRSFVNATNVCDWVYYMYLVLAGESATSMRKTFTLKSQ